MTEGERVTIRILRTSFCPQAPSASQARHLPLGGRHNKAAVPWDTPIEPPPFCYLRFAWNVVKMNRCRGRNLCLQFLNRIPFFFRTREINIGQATATIERMIANARNTIGNRDARQATATRERRRANARDAVANRNARQAIAIKERRRANARDAVANRNARQAIAITERSIANARDAVGNRNARQATATSERIRANARDAVGNYVCCGSVSNSILY